MVTKAELEEGYEKSLEIYVGAARTVLIGTALMGGINKKKAVEVALNPKTVDFIAKQLKELIDFSITSLKEV